MKKDKIIFDKEKSEYNYKGTEVVSDNSDEVDENWNGEIADNNEESELAKNIRSILYSIF